MVNENAFTINVTKKTQKSDPNKAIYIREEFQSPKCEMQLMRIRRCSIADAVLNSGDCQKCTRISSCTIPHSVFSITLETIIKQ